MAEPLVECIPNFSEARRPEVVESIIQSISAVPGVSVLDRHSDLDHNRTVITFVGSPDGVEEAAFQAIRTAAENINLDHHTGEHPRLGATDVVPFVPIREVTMQDCVEMARRLGKRVGESLKIPVYLYEEAATRPERRNLENVRRGEYEALKEEIGVHPEREPDFGPARVGPAGATIIGAREPLIAFNAFLTTDDVAIARKIARAIRFSSGGLRFVKALGLLVDGRAQVSMNLTNFRKTPIARVVEMIRSEARRYGVDILCTELVGLIPQEALVDAAVWHLQMDLFKPEQILEQRMAEAQAQNNEPAGSQFLDRLASGTPTPGGGSAAAYTGAAASALVSMVARLSTGKKKYAAIEPRMLEIAETAENLRAELTEAVSQDSAAFEAYIKALRMPKETPDQLSAREEAIEKATLETIHSPLLVSEKAVMILELALEVAKTGNLNAISDAASGAALARAALTASSLNVRINCPNLTDEALARTFMAKIHQLQSKADRLESELQKTLDERGNLVS